MAEVVRGAPRAVSICLRVLVTQRELDALVLVRAG